MGDKATVTARKRKNLAVDCSVDTGVRAVFFCSRCKKPFCEDCLGLEEGKTLCCLACAAIEGIKEREKSKHREVKSKTSTPLMAILAVLVVIGGYFFIAGEQSSRPKREPLPPLTLAQEADLAKCKENLHALSILVSEYQITQGHDPEDVEDIIQLEKEAPLLFEPVEGYEYGLESMSGIGLVVSCPNPDAHHLENLYAQPGSPAVEIQDGD